MDDDPSDQAGETGGDNESPGGGQLSLFSMALWGPDGPPERIFGRHDWGVCSENGEHPDKCWGHTSPIREPVAIPPPQMVLSREEMQQVAVGYRPIDMNDKWLAFMEDDRLFLHRSWTGHGIYEVRFAAKGLSWTNETGFMPTSAKVERDPRRYNPDDFDPIRERDFLSDLIVHVSGEPMPISLPIVAAGGPTNRSRARRHHRRRGGCHRQSRQPEPDRRGRSQRRHPPRSGPELLAYCKRLDSCSLGRATVTPGYRLDARWVIHTVTPQWRGGNRGEPVLLESCYRESLAQAEEIGADSISFPALGTGAHGYPLDAAATTAVNMVRSTPTDISLIRFVCFDEKTLSAFQSALGQDG